MKLEIKFLSSRSGRSLLLKIEDKTYLFNLFEGFQRYCIEQKQSLNAISVFFLTNRFNVPPLMATYLSLLDSEMGKFLVVSSFDVNFRSIHKFAYREDCAPTFKNQFSDKFISVQIIDARKDSTSNFLISFTKIRGKFYPEKLPIEMPKVLYKELISKQLIVFEGQKFNLNDFSDPEIVINEICLVFSSTDFENLPKDAKCFFCFNEKAYEYVSKHYSELKSPKNEIFTNLTGIYLISDNCEIEYQSFYEHQEILNRTDPRFILPFSFESKSPLIDTNFLLKTGDRLIFNKETGFTISRHLSKQYIPQIVPFVPLYPSIQFLGTGCAIPSKHRNVSSILYQNKDHAILLDSGEDTLFQIERLFGSFDILKKIKIIYISHLHADHMVGIASIVKKIPNNVTVIAPEFIREYLRYFEIGIIDDENDLLDKKVEFISTTPIKTKGIEYYSNIEQYSFLKDEFIQTITIDEFTFKICACIHSKSSTSVSIIDNETGKSFSYSGDTVPSTLFAHISTNNDVMIHEATFELGLDERAEITEHTMYHEAIEIFRMSGAKQLLLTHFSNRIKKSENEVIEPEDVKSVGDFFNYTFP